MRRNGYARLSQIPEEILNVNTISLLRQSQRRWPLDALLSITQIKFHATDHRDKIYGLLGMAAESQHSTALPEALIADYTVDVRHTYLKVARYLLENSRSLAILTRTRGTDMRLTRKRREHEMADLPSWLPDWSDFTVYGREICRSLSWIHYSDKTRSPYFGFPKHYNASAGLELKLHHTPNNAVLRVDACRVWKIGRAISMNEHDVSEAIFGAALPSTIARVCEVALPHLHGEDIVAWVSEIIKTTTAEQSIFNACNENNWLKDGAAFLQDVLSASEVEAHALIINDIQRESKGGVADRYAALARNFCFDRSFFTTSSGRMGIGPSDTRENDVIAVIPGGGVPYVLRHRNEGGWLFVGESYVAGLMNGEAIQLGDRIGLSMEMLDIY